MENFNQSLGGMLPESMQWAVGPLVALVTLVIGWVVAMIVRAVVSGAINRTGIGQKAQSTGGNIGKSIGKAFYWIILLVALLMALGQFEELKEPLAPLNDMMSGILGYGKNLIGAGLLLLIGGIVAKVGKEATQSSLEAVQIDGLATRAGLRDENSNSSIPKSMGGLVFALIIIFFGISAIDTLEIDVISTPIKGMLQTVFDYIPNVFGAAIVLAIAVWIGRFVSNLARNTLPALGVDTALTTLAGLDGETKATVIPSKLISTIVFIGFVLMGLIGATFVLNIPVFTELFEKILDIGSGVVFGAVIIGVGIFIANFVSKIVSQVGGALAGNIIRYAAIILFTFIGLETMQLGKGIVETAFDRTLTAAAVAAGVGGAIAFGMGGREWAGKKLEEWMPTKKAAPRRKTK